MIFKVRQEDTEKWFFYDRIRLAKTYFRLRGLDEGLSDENVVLLSEGRDLKDKVRVCDLIFEDDSRRTIYFVEGYLLNDEGKTIEHL